MKMINENKTFIFDAEISLFKYAIKYILNIFASTIYKIINCISRKKIKNKKYYASICAIFKNEAKYIKEWIEFHRIIGIDHFYLYNNNSNDNYEEVLSEYIKSGIVELVDWEKNQAQMEAYKDCISKKKNETNWLGFIDIDEFIVPIKYNNIKIFLKKFEKVGSINIYWKMFCSSGKLDRKTNLVTNDFVVSWPKLTNIGKCFFNTAYTFDLSKKNSLLHHNLYTKRLGISIPPVNSANKFTTFGIHRYKKNIDIQINHYFTKTYEEYKAKKAKGDVYFSINPHDEEYFYEHEMKCTACDYSVFKYLIRLKLCMIENKKNE